MSFIGLLMICWRCTFTVTGRRHPYTDRRWALQSNFYSQYRDAVKHARGFPILCHRGADPARILALEEQTNIFYNKTVMPLQINLFILKHHQ
jgi:hypothetical protein